ncbi:hypothetical protein QBC43DRAFT_679 [Cladorrhinum sp. PSN259]|nr:hypothetical protein QBC43DRAFT_679 [Cladorrhinum sp. PSN259]
MGGNSYDDPAAIVAGTVVMQVVSTLCVGLRFYSRRWKHQSCIVSDWLILAAWVFGTGLSFLMLYGVSRKSMAYPIGGNIWDPKAVNGRLNRAKHSELSYLLIGITALGLVKLSVTFLYWHLFARVMFRRFLIFWMIIVTTWAVAFVMAGLLECGRHLKAIFGEPQEYLDHCGSAMPSGYAMVASDILTDFVTLVIPIPVILTIKMSARTRILTLMTFLIGGLSVGASIAKAYIYITATLGLNDTDAISILTGIGIWNLVEVQVGIIAACGPTLRPILARIFPFEAATYSLMSLLGIPSTRKGTSRTLPSFVKMPESSDSAAGASEEKLQRASSGVGGGKDLSARSASSTVVVEEHEMMPSHSDGHGRRGGGENV